MQHTQKNVFIGALFSLNTSQALTHVLFHGVRIDVETVQNLI